MARKQRDLKLEQVWRRHLEQQRSSGLTFRAYCRAHALRETAFFFWRKEIATRPTPEMQKKLAERVLADTGELLHIAIRILVSEVAELYDRFQQ